jgi:hypothetical protein
LQVSTGRAANILKTMLIVTGVGTAAGATLGAVTYEPCDAFLCLFNNSRLESALFGAAALGTVSLPVGLIAGLIAADEGWRPASIDRTADPSGLSLRVAPGVFSDADIEPPCDGWAARAQPSRNRHPNDAPFHSGTGTSTALLPALAPG